MSTDKVLYSIEEVTEKIKSGKPLIVAGVDKLLSQLPKGNWIGGTIPYFMGESGGVFEENKIYVTEFPDGVKDVSFLSYDIHSIRNVYTDSVQNGFSIIIMPSHSKTQLQFSLDAPMYPEFASNILIGWVSGVALDKQDIEKAKVYNGKTGEELTDGAVTAHVTLNDDKIANVGIINIFEQSDGDIIEFPKTGFKTKVAIIDGKEVNFYNYLKENNIDTRLPLVADFYGANINTSFQSINKETGEIDFFAPVFEGMEYKLARPVDDYVKEFMKRLEENDSKKWVFSCSCLLNYIYSELEGKKTGGITGPVTYGEIAYQMLNQTLVYVGIDDI